jgi:hypothetical protein
MILSPHWYTRTSVSGLLSFGTAAVSTCTAWFWVRCVPEFVRLAACLTILESFLFFDIAVDGRWALHSKLIQFALHFGFYEQRRNIQIVGLATASVALLFGMTMIAHRLRGKWCAIVAGWSALLSVAT